VNEKRAPDRNDGLAEGPVAPVQGTLRAFAEHGPAGTGEPLSVLLRKGNAESNTRRRPHHRRARSTQAAPLHRPGRRPGRQILIRAYAGGCTHAFLSMDGQRLRYLIGFALPTDLADQLDIPRRRVDAYDADGKSREGAHVAEVTDLLDPQRQGWPAGMRSSSDANDHTPALSCGSPKPPWAGDARSKESQRSPGSPTSLGGRCSRSAGCRRATPVAGSKTCARAVSTASVSDMANCTG
jgi:hypothetical protein